MDANSRRMLQKLWKDRHTHSEGELQEIEQRLIRVEVGLDPVATRSGAHIHLLGGSQSVGATGAMVEWDSFDSQNPARNFSPSLPATWVPVMLDGYYRIRSVFRLDSYEGGLVEVYRRRGSNEVKVWPPDDSLVSSLHGDRVGADADGIECRVGDEIGIRLIPGAGATVTLLSGSLTVALIDRTPLVPVAAPSADWELVFATSNKFGVTFDGTHFWLTDPRSSISPVFYKFDASWNQVAAVGSSGWNRSYRGVVAYDGALWATYRGTLSDQGNFIRKIDPADGSVLLAGESAGAFTLHDLTLKTNWFAMTRSDRESINEYDVDDLSFVDSWPRPAYIYGIHWDAGASVWWVCFKHPLGDPLIRTYDESFDEVVAEFDAPETFTGLQLVSGVLYGVGPSGVWRRAVT